MLNKAISLTRLDRLEDALKVYDEVIDRYGEAEEPILRKHAAAAMANKVDLFRTMDRAVDASATYNELISRYGDDPEGEVREVVDIARESSGKQLPM